MIAPGKTIGILGGGQLGRMTAIAARQLGYGIVVLDPDPAPPAAAVADRVFTAAFDDAEALRLFGESSDVVTLEFENIPVQTLQQLQNIKPVRPGPGVLEICQHREREKNFLRTNGFPCANFAAADSQESLLAAVQSIGCPCVAKTAAWGYDGKGQIKILSPDEVPAAWKTLTAERVIVEQWIPFQLELSVVCARNSSGDTAVFPPSENIHTNHILDVSLVPGRFSETTAAEAVAMARALAEKLQVEGLLAVEMFLTGDDQLIVNEMAPRPHNSGHYTLDACGVSQFEQHVRAVCELPLGATDLIRPAVMLNLLGDVWAGGEPSWAGLFAQPEAHLHLYGKKHARPGRKMGHFTVLGQTVEMALERAMQIRGLLAGRSSTL